MTLTPLLSLDILLILPLITALLIGFIPSRSEKLIQFIAIASSSLVLIYTGLFYLEFDSHHIGLQFIPNSDLSIMLGTQLKFGIDGISYPMVLLANLLSWVAILVSGSTITQHIKGYYVWLLLLQSAMIGVFTTQDWALFYIFWEATLIPLFFLINRWGGQKRQAASLNFLLYTLGGSVLMLLSLLLAFDLAGFHSFAFDKISQGMENLDEHQQILIFLGLLIGFGVKFPIFPLHGWLPLAHVEAPGPVSILLSGILLKMGAYGLIRATDMLPKAALALQTALFILALIAIFYGALLAWRQTDMKKMIAYSSFSHMGIVLLGIASLSSIGMTGAVFQMVAHGLVAAALFMLISLLYARTDSRELSDYGSLIRTAPKFAFFMALALVAGIGMPGTINFVAELHIIIATWQTWNAWVAVLAVGLILGSVYHLRAAQYLLTGSVKPQTQHIVDLRFGEMLAVSILMIGVIGLGLFPNSLLEMISGSVNPLVFAWTH